jgi:integrase
MPRPKSKIPELSERDGIYYATWYDAKERRTKRRSLRTDDVSTARNRFAAFLVEDRGLIEGSIRAAITVPQALDDYWREHVASPKVKDKTRQENAIRHLKAYFGDMPLKDIDIPACESYADARRSGAVGGGKRHFGDRAKGSDSTIRRELTVLRAAAEKARRRKRISVEDMPIFEMPPENTRHAGEEPWLPMETIGQLIALAEEDLRDFIVLAYWTGSRRAAIEQLRVDQVKLEQGYVDLQPLGAQTTKKRRPRVPIFPEMRAVLERRIAGARAGWLFGPTVDFYRPFRALCREIGVDDARDHPHVLRHSRATHMLMAGESIYKVARLLGDTVATIEKRYGHSSVEFLMEGN